MVSFVARYLSTQQLMLIGLGLFAAATLLVGGNRTGATFAAETVNQGNLFGMGTLVMANTKGSEAICYSSANGTTDTNANTCSTLIDVAAKRPGEEVTQVVTVKNAGTITADVFQLSGTCAAGDTAADKIHGAGNPCTAIQFYVQQCSDAACATPVACAYGAGNGKTCEFGDKDKTLGAFASNHTTDKGLSLGTLEGGATTYYRIGLKADPKASNAVQGRQASFDLAWRFAQ
jgi:hypothetical protein